MAFITTISQYFFGDDENGVSTIDKYTQKRLDARPDANSTWLKISTAIGFTFILFFESFVIIAMTAVSGLIYCTMREWAIVPENFGDNNEYLAKKQIGEVEDV